MLSSQVFLRGGTNGLPNARSLGNTVADQKKYSLTSPDPG